MADTEKMLTQALAELRQQESRIRYQTRRILDIQRYESECFELRQQCYELRSLLLEWLETPWYEKEYGDWTAKFGVRIKAALDSATNSERK